MSSLFEALETKLDNLDELYKIDVVDPGPAAEAGQAADAKSTYEDLNRILTKLAKKADKATTLAGYGITDAAAKTEIAAKADLVDGRVPAAQLPSYVDDVLEYDAVSAFPATGESGKIYVAKDANKTYRWSGTQYVEISPLPVLDDTVTETSSNGVKSSGIWSWVKSLIPNWLTSDYAEPATVASVANKRDKDDLAVYEVVRTENTDWTWTSENKELEAALNTDGVKPVYVMADIPGWNEVYPNPGPSGYFAMEFNDWDKPRDATSLRFRFVGDIVTELFYATATRPRYMDETLGSAKQNQQLAAVATGDAQTPANGDLVKYDAANNRFVKATASDIPELPYLSTKNGGTVDGFVVFNGLVVCNSEIQPATVRAMAGDVLATVDGNIHNLSYKADRATTLSGYGITDGATKASLAPEYSATSAYSVGSIVWHDGNIYQCKTAIAEGGEAWNAEHWELRKLDDFFTESNSLLMGTIEEKVISMFDNGDTTNYPRS